MPRNRRHAQIILLLALSAGAFLFAACAGDFVQDPDRPRPARAVQSPVGIASPNSEVIGGPQGAIPFVTVDFPNRKDGQVQVHTLGESLTGLTQTASATQRAAATEPSQPTEPPVQESVEIVVDAAIRIVQKQNAADTLVAAMAGEKVTLSVVNESGVGSAVLERTGDKWPATIAVRFSHGTRPFARLEGFTANELTEAGGKVALKAEVNKEAATAVISIPGFAHSSRISIEWVNEYR